MHDFTFLFNQYKSSSQESPTHFIMEKSMTASTTTSTQLVKMVEADGVDVDVDTSHSQPLDRMRVEDCTALTDIQHVLQRPDNEMGSVLPAYRTRWVISEDFTRSTLRRVFISSGLIHCVSELLVNVVDNASKNRGTTNLWVTVDDNSITVKNNGNTITVEKHKGSGKWAPELLTSQLRTSTEYSEERKECKTAGGRNGKGAKVANIMSLKYTVHIENQDDQDKKKKSGRTFHQVSRNNMRDVGKAVVCEKAVVGNFMSVTMVPDLERFGNTTGKFTQDTVDMLRTIVAQAAAIARLNATFNGVKIETNSFKSLVQTLCNIAPADNNKSSTKALGGGLDMPPLEDLGEEADVGTVSMKQEQQGDCQLDLGDKVEINSKPKVADTKLPMAFAQFGDMNTVFGGTHKRRNPYVWEVAIIPNVWVHGNVGGVACDSIMQNKSKPKSKAKTKSGDDGDDNDTLRVQGLWFVNGVRTWDGGSHVEGVSTALTKAFKQHMVTVVKSWVRAGLVDKECRIPSNQQLLLSYVLVCVNCRIASPEFGGQTKVKMIKSISKFRKQLTTTVFDKLAEKAANRIGWAQYVQSLVMRNTRAATKKLGATKARTVNVPKYEGANFAGKKGSQECTLMLVEGDSAKGFAVTGMSVVGRDRYGVFPLRGKVLNTLDYSFPKAMKNQELLYIVKILGLKPDVVYTKNNVSTLRYGSVMIMTDQDHDGSHIKSLVILFFWRFWPSLLEIGFLKEFNTPILKAIHRRNPKLTRSFFDQLKFDRWWKTLNVKERQRDWKTKYYKGLGTSTQKEIYGYFENLDDHVRPISFVEDRDTLFIAKAFDKKQSNKRKGWINRFVRMKHEANAKGEVMKSGHKESGAKRICDIVDYELVQYSWANCQRTLPSIIDGFKDGQRKAMSMPLAELGCLWTPDLLRRISANTLASSSSSSPPSLDLSKLLKVGIERKVLQHGSRTSEVRNYRYGDSALNDTIINMNQQFVGSNNISLLFPIGGFGNRHENGDNASSPRYIYTALNLVSAALFPPEDLPILHYAHMDDIGGGEGGDLDNLEAGGVVLSKKPWLTEEPTYFVPILPVVLMNQIGGIATGWSCNIPPHNPADLKAYTLRLISSLVTHTTPTHNTNVSADTLIKSALAWMDQNPCTIEPWFRGFTGTVHVMDDKKTKFQVRGTCRLISSSDVSKKKRARTSTTSTSTEPQVSKSTTATTDTTATTTTQRHVIEISEIPPGKKTRDIMDWLKSENAFVYNPALGLGGAKLKKPKGERGKKKSSSSSTTKIKVEKVAEKAKKRPKIGLNVDPRLIQLSDHKTDHEVRLTLTITLPNSEINAVVKAIQDRLVETIHYNNMNMFDANGTITRYKSVHHVFSHFVPQRLMAYERRKKWLIEQKEQSLVQMRATIAFIDLVFSNKIKLLNRPRREIQQSCRVHKLPEVNGNYQYLLRKSITTITLEESKRLRAQLVEQESLLAAIHSKSLLTMWRLDLERFQKCERLYRLYCEDMRSSAAKVRTRTKKRKAQGKQKTQRKRKFI